MNSSTLSRIFLFLLLLWRIENMPTTAQAICDAGSINCVCDIPQTLDIFWRESEKIIGQGTWKQDPAAMMKLVNGYQCVGYTVIPSTLHLKWGGSYGLHPYPRRMARSLADNDNYPTVSRSRREARLGYPSDGAFRALLPQLEDKSDHQYIPLGAMAELPCTGANAEAYEIWRPKHFQWSHSDGSVVSSTGAKANPTTGTLGFQAVQLSDSDVYQCNLTFHGSNMPYDGDEEGPKSYLYLQQLDVVAEPIVWLKFSIMYSTPECNREEISVIKSHIKELIHRHVCFFCTVRNQSVSCLKDSRNSDDYVLSGGEDGQKRVVLRVAVSALGAELLPQLVQFKHGFACNVACIEALHLKLLQIVRNSMEKLFQRNIEIERPDLTVTYPFLKGSATTELLEGCPSGFFQRTKLCFPCPPGKYSPDGKEQCHPCPEGTYQPTPGSGACLDCPEGYSTLVEGSIGEYDCKLNALVQAVHWSEGLSFVWRIVLLVLALLILVIILLICLIPYCSPTSRLGRCCAPCSCCGPKDSEQKRRGSYEMVQEDSDEGDESGITKIDHQEQRTLFIEKEDIRKDVSVREKKIDTILAPPPPAPPLPAVQEIKKTESTSVAINSYVSFENVSPKKSESKDNSKSKRKSGSSFWSSSPKNTKLGVVGLRKPQSRKKLLTVSQSENKANSANEEVKERVESATQSSKGFLKKPNVGEDNSWNGLPRSSSRTRSRPPPPPPLPPCPIFQPCTNISPRRNNHRCWSREPCFRGTGINTIATMPYKLRHVCNNPSTDRLKKIPPPYPPLKPWKTSSISHVGYQERVDSRQNLSYHDANNKPQRTVNFNPVRRTRYIQGREMRDRDPSSSEIDDMGPVNVQRIIRKLERCSDCQ